MNYGGFEPTGISFLNSLPNLHPIKHQLKVFTRHKSKEIPLRQEPSPVYKGKQIKRLAESRVQTRAGSRREKGAETNKITYSFSAWETFPTNHAKTTFTIDGWMKIKIISAPEYSSGGKIKQRSPGSPSSLQERR